MVTGKEPSWNGVHVLHHNYSRLFQRKLHRDIAVDQESLLILATHKHLIICMYKALEAKELHAKCQSKRIKAKKEPLAVRDVNNIAKVGRRVGTGCLTCNVALCKEGSCWDTFHASKLGNTD